MKTILSVFFAASIVALFQTRALAVLQSPLHIGTTNSITNERGQPLPGSDTSAALFNQPVVTGDLVQIIRTYNGAIDAPAANGLPVGTNNIVIATTRIGIGVDPAAGQIGQFGISLPDYDGSTLFVRVFNAPDLAGASFYGDSQVYSNNSTYSVFIPNIASVQPLDAADSDADGLNNSWEKSLGTNPNNKDTDGDGISDYNEVLSGTDASDSGSYLRMVQIMPALNGDSIIFWSSVIGKTYQIQYNAGDLGTTSFIDLGSPIVATGTTAQIIHTNGTASPGIHYRVKFIQ